MAGREEEEDARRRRREKIISAAARYGGAKKQRGDTRDNDATADGTGSAGKRAREAGAGDDAAAPRRKEAKLGAGRGDAGRQGRRDAVVKGGDKRAVGGDGGASESHGMYATLEADVLNNSLFKGRSQARGAEAGSRSVQDLLARLVRYHAAGIPGADVDSLVSAATTKLGNRVLVIDGSRKKKRSVDMEMMVVKKAQKRERQKMKRAAARGQGTRATSSGPLTRDSDGHKRDDDGDVPRVGSAHGTRHGSAYAPVAATLHSMWTEYIASLMKEARGGSVESALRSANYHGSRIKVIRSTDPQLVCKGGIVLKDNANSFLVLDTDGNNKLRGAETSLCLPYACSQDKRAIPVLNADRRVRIFIRVRLSPTNRGVVFPKKTCSFRMFLPPTSGGKDNAVPSWIDCSCGGSSPVGWKGINRRKVTGGSANMRMVTSSRSIRLLSTCPVVL